MQSFKIKSNIERGHACMIDGISVDDERASERAVLLEGT